MIEHMATTKWVYSIGIRTHLHTFIITENNISNTTTNNNNNIGQNIIWPRWKSMGQMNKFTSILLHGFYLLHRKIGNSYRLQNPCLSDIDECRQNEMRGRMSARARSLNVNCEHDVKCFRTVRIGYGVPMSNVCITPILFCIYRKRQ